MLVLCFNCVLFHIQLSADMLDLCNIYIYICVGNALSIKGNQIGDMSKLG